MRAVHLVILCISVTLMMVGCVHSSSADPAVLQVQATAFKAGAPIPTRYTCDGDDMSPVIQWHYFKARAFAVIVIDPDAPSGDFAHWVLFNIPGEISRLEENVLKIPQLPNGARQGMNDFGQMGYGGPCPPRGKVHHYHFHVYALDAPLKNAPGANARDILAAMKGHIVAQGETVGTYRRP